MSIPGLLIMAVALSCTSLAVGCGGGHGGDGVSGGNPGPGDSGGTQKRTAYCQYVAGGASQVTSAGPVSDATAAGDGDLASFARMNLSRTTTSASIRATAQAGVVFPEKSRAGAYTTQRNIGTVRNTSLRTYLNGALQETGDQNEYGASVGDATSADEVVWFTTTKSFDAVEITTSDSGDNATPDYRVYEICADAYVQ